MSERPSADRWLAMTAAQLIEELERVGAELDAVTRERDEARKEVERLQPNRWARSRSDQ